MRFPDHRCNLLDDCLAFEGAMISNCRSNGILLPGVSGYRFSNRVAVASDFRIKNVN